MPRGRGSQRPSIALQPSSSEVFSTAPSSPSSQLTFTPPYSPSSQLTFISSPPATPAAAAHSSSSSATTSAGTTVMLASTCSNNHPQQTITILAPCGCGSEQHHEVHIVQVSFSAVEAVGGREGSDAAESGNDARVIFKVIRRHGRLHRVQLEMGEGVEGLVRVCTIQGLDLWNLGRLPM